nr:outer membrane protein assembly factor BamE [Notoacmeibacter ruber]
MNNCKIKLAVVAAGFLALPLAGCNSTDALKLNEEFQQGYVIDEDALAATPVGSSREQVLLSLGSPSIKRDFGQGERYYYISQIRQRPVGFAQRRIVDQRVLAVSFDEDGRVSNIANYGLKDGRVFDFIGRTTPTGGRETTFIGGVLSGLGRGAPSAGGF